MIAYYFIVSQKIEYIVDWNMILIS